MAVPGRAHEDDVAGSSLWTSRPVAVAPAPTLVRLTSSCTGLLEGEPLTLAAEVVTVARTTGVPAATGTVTFSVDGEVLGTAGLDSSGQAVLTGLRLPVGLHAVVASYGGDPGHAAASSAPLPQAITAAAAAVVVLVVAPVRAEHGTVLEAELVDPSSGRLAEDAAGELVFTVGRTAVGSAELVGGRAQLVVPVLPPGRLRVAFAGDTEHAPAVGVADGS